LELIVIRHAIAEEREDFAKKNLEDSLRPLTMKGRKRMQKIAMMVRDQIDELDVIVSSPFTRARQTAEIVSQIHFEVPVLEAPELVPQSPPASFVKWLRVQGKKYQRIAIVGHEPHLSSLCSYLLSGKTESFIDLRKGGVLSLQLESFAQAEPACAQLLWSVPPRFFID
jgi:phosphohistidine phosphatase